MTSHIPPFPDSLCRISVATRYGYALTAVSCATSEGQMPRPWMWPPSFKSSEFTLDVPQSREMRW